ncbi:caspase-7-like [Ptychodera flava]|uniref:caspase-7-like n=1 Tax=Ptychodera flava TaxID=63121 RepID=UPI00396A8776
MASGSYNKKKPECNLRQRNLTHLPDWVTKDKSLKRLVKIDARSNNLKDLPDAFEELKCLEVLWLSVNDFTNVPSVVMKLQYLRCLEIDHNKLTKIPASLCNLGLETLDLSHNKISSLPNEIHKLKYLKIFNISHNELKVIHESICDLTGLCKLNASHNKLTKLPVGLGVRQCKLDLSVGGNPLQEPPIDVCNKGMESIREYWIAKQSAKQPNKQNKESAASQKQASNGTYPKAHEQHENGDQPASGPERSTSAGSTGDIRKTSCYKMEREPRGVAIIISNHKFTREEDTRAGTETDTENLKRLFTHLKFNVLLYKDKTAEEIKKILEVASIQDHSQHDCFVVCILSHGGPGVIYGCDSEPVQIIELARYFTAPSCNTLAGKPKLFFMQACQGKEPSHGLIQFPPADAARGGRGNAPAGTIVPVWSDFLLGYSTFPGCKSYRDPDPKKGSYYISKLVHCIREHHKEFHLLDILTMVNAEVAQESNMMVPAPLFTLTKSVYL